MPETNDIEISTSIDELTDREIDVFSDNIVSSNEERALLQGPEYCNKKLLQAPGKACARPYVLVYFFLFSRAIWADRMLTREAAIAPKTMILGPRAEN